ncbi:DUF1707 SHOCT-like domain-containing protein [Nocardia bovistercoris]|uniref:DUF1707 domain-containing protein n=1 Tax=Nocardia bovistercoris TaxID=2785916 RepID=A0A931N1X3_9NOCA|nr:DUF1707 domain-containing protein [Nocardia bovistercoris]MBH0775401.1 DUF1707 domain-containing protein [Nocardia bovistercoris]
MDIATGTRASDAERDAVVRLLARHLAEGRIDLTEYDQRVAAVYGAATRDDLHLVLGDLPALSKPALTEHATRPRRVPLWQRIEATTWFGVSLLVLVIWAAISLGVGEFTYFWPVWVIGPWGAVLAFRMVTGFESGLGCGRRRV